MSCHCYLAPLAEGAEVIAPILADWMYGVKDTEDLISEQKKDVVGHKP